MDDILIIYEDVLSGKRTKFPYGFWNDQDSYRNSGVIVRYLTEEILEWNEDDVKSRISLEVFKQYRLRGMIAILYNESVYACIDNAYPNKYKQWELPNTPLHFWNETTAIEATKWLIEEKLKWSNEQVQYDLKKKTFEQNGLAGMLERVYNNSIVCAVKAAYPNIYNSWEFTRVPKNYWDNKENIADAINTVAMRTHPRKPITKDFRNMGLKYLMEKFFSYDIDRALEFVKRSY